jgi:uncharacterized protein YbjT (DUF2867 family)
MSQMDIPPVLVTGATGRVGRVVIALLLVVSELVANAVRHAGGVSGFRLETRAGIR